MRFTGPVEKPGWHKRLRTAWRRWQNSRVSRREQFDMIQMKIDTALAATSCAMVELHKEHLRTAAEFRKKIVELEKRLRESGNG
jgi:hypothetical protein